MKERIRAGVLLVIAALGCAAPQAATDRPSETLIISLAAGPDNLFPPLVRTLPGLQVSDQIFERLADLKPSGNTAAPSDFAPRLATSWEWSNDSLSIRFHINPGARWHDGARVKASDVVFSFSVYKDPAIYDAPASLAAIDSVTATDSSAVVFWFSARSADQFYTATSILRILPEHLLGSVPVSHLITSDFARNPVGSGPFRFVRWNADQGSSIELEADTSNYLGRPAVDRVVYMTAGTFNAAASRVMSGDADFVEVVHPAMEELLRNQNVRAVTYPAPEYSFIAFNFRERPGGIRPHPVLSDRGVRAAIALAINREVLVRSALDSLGVVALGPFIRSGANADTTLRQIPFDPARATRILDSLGWRIPPGGELRARGGRSLEFSLLVPGSSEKAHRVAQFVKGELGKIGINVLIEEVDYQTYAARLDAHDFDSYFGTHAVSPSPASFRNEWGAASIVGASSLNHGIYENRVMTMVADSAIAELDAKKRKALFRRVYQTVTDEVAAIWIYERKNVAAVDARLRLPPLSAHGWWTNLREWRFEPAAPSQPR